MVIAMRRLAVVTLLAATMVGTGGCRLALFENLNLPNADVDRERLARATEVNPRNAHAWFLQGRAMLDDNDAEGARVAFRHALGAQPNFEEARLGIGLSYLNQNQWDRAAAEYQTALKQFPRSAAAYEGLAAAELGRKRLDACAAAANQALALDANSPQGHRLLGEVAYVRGDYDQALAHWEAAGELNPRLASQLEGIRKDLTGYLARYGSPSGS